MRFSFAGAALSALVVSVQPALAQFSCPELTNEARAFAAQLNVTFAMPQPATVGSEIKVRWAAAQMRSPRVPTYLVISAPSASRVSGKGFLTLGPDAIGPDKIAHRKSTVRAFVPLHRPAHGKGEIAIKTYFAGLSQYSWAVVSGGPCGQNVYQEKTASLTASPGAPVLVMQEAFAADRPLKRYRSRDNKNDLLVFAGHYEVRSVATGAKIAERAGLDPNFSPTGRFVVARNASDRSLDVVDTASGTLVADFLPDALVWSRNDSFVLNGVDRWGQLAFRQMFSDSHGAGGGNLSCHGCSGLESSVILDLEHGYFAAHGAFSGYATDLYSGNEWSTPEKQDREDLVRTNLTRHIQQTYNPELRQFAKRWDLGEPPALTEKPHPRNETVKAFQQFYVAPREVQDQPKQAASPDQLVGLEYVRRSATESNATVLDKSLNFELLKQAGIPTLLPSPSAFNAASKDQATWKPVSESLFADMRKRVPESAAAFVKTVEFQCDSGSTPTALKVPLDYITQIQQWDSTTGRHWLVEAVCFAGSAHWVNYSDLVLITEERGAARVRSVEKLLGVSPDNLDNTNHEPYALYPYNDGYVFAASITGGFASLIDVKGNRRDGAMLKIVQPDLLSELRRTSDGKHAVQLNKDNQFYVFRLADGARVFSGAVLDGEVVTVLPDGRYETSYEGANSVQVRFPGVEGLYTFHQFDAVLHRKGLARKLLAGEPVEPRPAQLSAPPRAHLTLSNTAKDGARTGTITIASEKPLDELRFYVDGLKIHSAKITGTSFSSTGQIPDPGAGRFISVVAVDSGGLASLPSSIRIPGNPAPAGTLRGVFVGIDNYDDRGLPKLSAAALDARNLAAALKTGNRALQTVDVRTLLNKEATAQAILDSVKAAAAATTKDDTLVLFFAGHGVDGRQRNQPDAGLVLALPSTRLDNLKQTALPWAALSAALREARGKIVVILDACHAGIAGSEVIASNDSIVDTLVTASGAPMVILAGSKGRQQSRESGNGGIFTSALIAALTTERQSADLDRSGLLDIGEIYRAVKLRVLEQSQQQQTPWLARNASVGEISLF